MFIVCFFVLCMFMSMYVCFLCVLFVMCVIVLCVVMCGMLKLFLNVFVSVVMCVLFIDCVCMCVCVMCGVGVCVCVDVNVMVRCVMWIWCVVECDVVLVCDVLYVCVCVSELSVDGECGRRGDEWLNDCVCEDGWCVMMMCEWCVSDDVDDNFELLGYCVDDVMWMWCVCWDVVNDDGMNDWMIVEGDDVCDVGREVGVVWKIFFIFGWFYEGGNYGVRRVGVEWKEMFVEWWLKFLIV